MYQMHNQAEPRWGEVNGILNIDFAGEETIFFVWFCIFVFWKYLSRG